VITGSLYGNETKIFIIPVDCEIKKMARIEKNGAACNAFTYRTRAA
jgi:hypothetical protein